MSGGKVIKIEFISEQEDLDSRDSGYENET